MFPCVCLDGVVRSDDRESEMVRVGDELDTADEVDVDGEAGSDIRYGSSDLGKHVWSRVEHWLKVFPPTPLGGEQ